MTTRTRSTCLLAVLVTVAGVLAGCPAPDAGQQADDARLEVLRAEAGAADAQVTTAVAGWQESDRQAPVRGQVQATIEELDATDAIAEAREGAARAIVALRESDWTIYFVACVPPRSGEEVIDEDSALPTPIFDAWTFAAYGYKILDGVSYFARVNGVGTPPRNRAEVTLRLIAPYSGEAAADLFPDRPPATEVGASCVEQVAALDGLATLGTPTVVDEHGEEPGGTKADGHR